MFYGMQLEQACKVDDALSLVGLRVDGCDNLRDKLLLLRALFVLEAERFVFYGLHSEYIIATSICRDSIISIKSRNILASRKKQIKACFGA